MAGLSTVVARVSSNVEAHIIAGLLESNGIEAAVSSDDGGGNEPQFQLTVGVRVLVSAEDADAALDVIASAQAQDRRRPIEGRDRLG